MAFGKPYQATAPADILWLDYEANSTTLRFVVRLDQVESPQTTSGRLDVDINFFWKAGTEVGDQDVQFMVRGLYRFQQPPLLGAAAAEFKLHNQQNGSSVPVVGRVDPVASRIEVQVTKTDFLRVLDEIGRSPQVADIWARVFLARCVPNGSTTPPACGGVYEQTVAHDIAPQAELAPLGHGPPLNVSWGDEKAKPGLSSDAPSSTGGAIPWTGFLAVLAVAMAAVWWTRRQG